MNNLSETGIPTETIIAIGIVISFAIFVGVATTLIWAKFDTKKKISAFQSEFDNLQSLRAVTTEFVTDSSKKKHTLEQKLLSTQSELDELSEFKGNMHQFVSDRRPVYNKLKNDIASMESQLKFLYEDHMQVIQLAEKSDEIRISVDSLTIEQSNLLNKKNTTSKDIQSLSTELNDMRATLDLYSQQKFYVDHGHYDFPEYLYQSSEKYREEISRERLNQKRMVKENSAITNIEMINGLEDSDAITAQIKLMLRTYNIELDMLFGKIKHSNYISTVNRVDNLAKSLEKGITDTHFGISLAYVESKLRECTLIFQEQLVRKEEQEAAKLARAELTEERKAQREYDAALAKAQKEEKTYMDLLAQARVEILGSNNEEEAAEQKIRIQYLEQMLVDAQAQEERAKSLAQQTKCGYIYVISNEGSFGKGVYKIGLTRRLDPMDRVKELGDASVPFPFDVHGIIYSQNAPELESKMHQRFSDQRVNVVNFRKEFFKIDLQTIENALNELSDLNVTLSSEPGHNGDYEEAMRMRHESLAAQVELPA